MGKLEKEAKRKRRNRNIQALLLSTIAAAGAITVAAAIPGAFVAIGKIEKSSRRKLFYRAKTAAGRLAEKGFAEFIERDGKELLRLTDMGKRALILQQAKGGSAIRKPWRWDKRYRIVMFDIPERRKSSRNRVRELMKAFGFLRLQDSVWVVPYDCEELIALLKAELRIGKDLLYVIADQIENDGWIKSHFGLA